MSKRRPIPRKSFAIPSFQDLLQEEEAEREDVPALAVEACRSRAAVVHGWDSKVFPGEAQNIVSAARRGFTGAAPVAVIMCPLFFV